MKTTQNQPLIQVLQNFEGIFFDQKLKDKLCETYKIISKNIGIDKSSKSMKDFITQPYLLDRFSLAYLFEIQPNLFKLQQISENSKLFFHQIRDSFQFYTFKQLKDKYFLLNGHKFGCLFLAYDQNPQKNHAKSLIFCGVQSQKKSNFNHMTRLSEIAKKQCLFAYKKQDDGSFFIEELERQKGQTNKRDKKKTKVLYKQKNKVGYSL